MDFTLILTIIGSAVAIIGLVYTFLRNFKTDINKHIDDLRIENRQANTRIDILYQMFIENQKENHQKFYDLLKEGKK